MPNKDIIVNEERLSSIFITSNVTGRNGEDLGQCPSSTLAQLSRVSHGGCEPSEPSLGSKPRFPCRLELASKCFKGTPLCISAIERIIGNFEWALHRFQLLRTQL